MPPSTSPRRPSFLDDKPTAAFSPWSPTGVGSRAVQKGSSLSKATRRNIIHSIVHAANQEMGPYEGASPFLKATLDAHMVYPADRFSNDTLPAYSGTGPWRAEALIRSLDIIGRRRESDPPGPTAKSLTIDRLPTDIIVEAAATLSKTLREGKSKDWGDGTALSEVNDMISCASFGRRVPEVMKLQVAEHDAYLEFVSNSPSKLARNRYFHIMDVMTLVRGPDTVIGSKAFVLEVVPRYEQVWGDVESQNASATSLEYLRIRYPRLARDPQLPDTIIQADTDKARTARLQDGEGSIIDYLGEYELYKDMATTGESRQELMQTERSRRLQRLARKVVAERDKTKDQGYPDGEMS